MTSNLGSDLALEGNKEGVMQQLKSHFRPEFINRIDDVIIFNPLSKENINSILDKIIKEIEKRLKDKNIHIELTKNAHDNLIDNGYDIAYGARPLKRLVSRTVESLVAKELINANIKFNDTVIIDFTDNHFMLRKK